MYGLFLFFFLLENEKQSGESKVEQIISKGNPVPIYPNQIICPGISFCFFFLHISNIILLDSKKKLLVQIKEMTCIRISLRGLPQMKQKKHKK